MTDDGIDLSNTGWPLAYMANEKIFALKDKTGEYAKEKQS